MFDKVLIQVSAFALFWQKKANEIANETGGVSLICVNAALFITLSWIWTVMTRNHGKKYSEWKCIQKTESDSNSGGEKKLLEKLFDFDWKIKTHLSNSE